MEPQNGTMVYWRFKTSNPTPWRFGYVSQVTSGLIRMGFWNGDTTRGPVVDPEETEWKEHK